MAVPRASGQVGRFKIAEGRTVFKTHVLFLARSTVRAVRRTLRVVTALLRQTQRGLKDCTAGHAGEQENLLFPGPNERRITRDAVRRCLERYFSRNVEASSSSTAH